MTDRADHVSRCDQMQEPVSAAHMKYHADVFSPNMLAVASQASLSSRNTKSSQHEGSDTCNLLPSSMPLLLLLGHSPFAGGAFKDGATDATRLKLVEGAKGA